jgi:hypothetical protein
LLHGQDIDFIFSKDICLKEYLEYCLKRYSYDNLLHFSVEKWIEREKTINKATKTIEEIEKIDTNAIKDFLKIIISGKSIPEHEISLDLDELKEVEIIKIAEFLLQKYPTYYQAYTGLLPQNHNKLTNARKTLIHILSTSHNTNQIYLTYYYYYNNNPVTPYLNDFLWEPFKKYYSKLKQPEKEKFEKALVSNFNSILGSWAEENTITNVVEYIWPHILDNTKSDLLSIYVEIYFSNRSDKFEQKQFSYKLIENSDQTEFVKTWLENKIIEEIRSNNLKSDDIESEVKYFNRSYSKARHILSLEAEAWNEFIKQIYINNIGKKS